MEHRETSRRWTARRPLVGLWQRSASCRPSQAPPSARNYSGATNSSPITLSADGKYVWSVNPGADNVSVIYARTNKVIAKIKVGDEPQSVAVDPNNRYAYVANAAGGSVTVIRITRARAASSRPGPTGAPAGSGQIVTGV